MRKTIIAGMTILCAAAPAAVQPAAQRDMSGIWDRGATSGTPFQPPEAGPGPVLRLEGSTGAGGSPHGDYNAPILQPWAAAAIRQRVENDIAGVFQTEAKESCSPMGVPHIMQLSGPIKVLLTPEVATIIYLRMMQPRMIYLNEGHPADLKPSYYGHSVGHWEGETLVVDTVGFNDKTPIDLFGTPHTDQLHVLERYRVVDGETLHIDFTIEDPGAFTTAWSSYAEYGAPRRPYDNENEFVCQENNRLPDGSLVPGPTDETPDF